MNFALNIGAVLLSVSLLGPYYAHAQPRPPKDYLPVQIQTTGKVRATRAITLDEVRKKLPGATLDTVITTKAGKAMTVREALSSLNRLEKQYNSIGLSLRDTQRPRVQLISPLRVKPSLRTQLQSNVPFTAFPDGRWVATAGERDVVAVELVHQTSLSNAAADLTQSQAIALGGYIFGSYLPLTNASESGTLPAQLNGCSLVASLSVAGISAPPDNQNCAGASAITAISSKSVSVTQGYEYVQPLWGPLEVTVSAVLTAGGNVVSAVSGLTHQLDGTVSTAPEVSLLLRVLAGVYIADAGMQANLLLARYTLEQTSTTKAWEQPSALNWSTTNISWTSTYTRTFESLDGSISFVLVFDVPFFGEHVIEWTIYSWDGATATSQPVTWGPFTGTRPGVCMTSTGQPGAMCSGTCVSLLTSMNNCGACGNICPTGGIHPQCSQGKCISCQPSCSDIAPGDRDGCGGICPSCSGRHPFTGTYWCEFKRICTSSGNCPPIQPGDIKPEQK